MNEVPADVIMVLHAAYSVFVVWGLVVIAAGQICRWRWTRSSWLRSSHLTATLIVVVRAWSGLPCPLGVVEDQLRSAQAGPEVGGAFRDVMHRLAFRDEGFHDFTSAVSLFGGLVLLTWIVTELDLGFGADRTPHRARQERNRSGPH